MTHRIGILASLSLAAVAGAQSLPYCDRGPGGALGVKSYTCASCGAERKEGKDGKAVYSFATEPVVIEGALGSAFRPGDIITAVNGKPITTREGAEAFAYPTPGKVAVSYRRGANASSPNVVQATDTITVNASCNPVPTSWSRSVHFKPLAETIRWKAATDLFSRRSAGADSGGRFIYRKAGADSLLWTRTGPASITQPDPTSRLGFAVTCTPSCTRTTGRNGDLYWKHDDYPAIVAIRANSPAAESGLRLGDLIVEVDGKSVLEEAGALALQQSRLNGGRVIVVDGARTTDVSVVVMRDGARVERVLKIRD